MAFTKRHFWPQNIFFHLPSCKTLILKSNPAHSLAVIYQNTLMTMNIQAVRTAVMFLLSSETGGLSTTSTEPPQIHTFNIHLQCGTMDIVLLAYFTDICWLLGRTSSHRLWVFRTVMMSMMIKTSTIISLQEMPAETPALLIHPYNLSHQVMLFLSNINIRGVSIHQFHGSVQFMLFGPLYGSVHLAEGAGIVL